MTVFCDDMEGCQYTNSYTMLEASLSMPVWHDVKHHCPCQFGIALNDDDDNTDDV